jgi:adenine-specific DNA-methyltransferase
MHYLGSKERLIPFIKTEIDKTIQDSLHVRTFCDLFAGSAVVGKSFCDSYTMISNDMEYYSYIINSAYLLSGSLDAYQEQLERLNSLKGTKALIYRHYALGGGEFRNYFSDENAKKIDAIRQEIQRWYLQKLIDKNRYHLLLATLLESVTYISNTASIYSAFLKTLKKTAQQPLKLTPLHVRPNSKNHKVYNSDANTLIKEISGDILYLDPPYNLRQYGANYHILNTIAEYKEFSPKGKTGLRDYYSSPYSRRKSAYKTLEELLKNAKFSYIFLSYSSEGIIDNLEIENLMKTLGHYRQVSQQHKRYNSKKSRNNSDKTTEYLHILKKIHL